MIQRIQTVYLSLSAIAVASMYLLPLAFINGPQGEIYLKANGIWSSEQMDSSLPLVHFSFFPISALIAVEIIFTITVIFLFKKRNRQMMLGKLNLLILTVLIAVVFFYADYSKSLLGLPKDTLVNYQIACLLPVISIVLNYMAIRSIKKDEDLVRAADRLR